jgi:hypothetical protein
MCISSVEELPVFLRYDDNLPPFMNPVKFLSVLRILVQSRVFYDQRLEISIWFVFSCYSSWCHCARSRCVSCPTPGPQAPYSTWPKVILNPFIYTTPGEPPIANSRALYSTWPRVICNPTISTTPREPPMANGRALCKLYLTQSSC